MSYYLFYLLIDWYLIGIMNSDDFNSTDMNMDDDDELYKIYPYADYKIAYSQSLIASFTYIYYAYFLIKNMFVNVDNIIKNSSYIKYVYCNLDYIIKITCEDLSNLRVLKLAYSKIKTFIIIRSIKYFMSNPKIFMTARNIIKNIKENNKENIINVSTTLLTEQNKSKKIE
jgi:hypothetical protein